MRRILVVLAMVLFLSTMKTAAQSTSMIYWSRSYGACSTSGASCLVDGDCPTGQSCEPDESRFAIWSMTDNGTDQNQVTTPGTNVQDRHPSICSKARIIVFERNGDIYKVNNDGTGLESLTSDSGINEQPDCGVLENETDESIVFRSTRDSIYGEIYRMDLNGGNVERLTIDTAPQIYEDKDPAWCGDNLIVFSRRFVGSGEDWQVWVMDAEDGGNKDNLTNGNGDNDEFPACPGRGGRVAFTRDNASMMAPGISDIWIYSLSSESEQNETESQCPPELDDSYDSGPSWSPGETQITFSLKDFSETNPAEIYKFTVGDKTDGIGCGCGDPCLQTLVQLTDNEVIDIEPDWGEISP